MHCPKLTGHNRQLVSCYLFESGITPGATAAMSLAYPHISFKRRHYGEGSPHLISWLALAIRCKCLIGRLYQIEGTAACTANIAILSSGSSGRCKHGLEGVVGEPDGPGESPAVLVDHGDSLARRERPRTTRRVGADFVEVDDPEAGQRGERLVERPAASDARVDGDGRGKPGVDREVDRLRCGLVGQEVRRCAGLVGLKAQRAADYIAGADRQVDLPDTLCPDLAGDVLRGVDGHLDVDVEEAETDEGMEVVDADRAGGELQVGHRPGDEQGGERCRGAEELVAARLDGIRAQSGGGDRLLGRRCSVGPRLEMVEAAVAGCLSLPQRGHPRLSLGVRPQRQPVPHQVLLGGCERVEVLRWGWVEAHLSFVGLLFSHDTLLF